MRPRRRKQARDGHPSVEKGDFVGRRVAAIWNWLPTFRAVAELEQVHAAARRLHVAPSAVSRTVKVLEAELGWSLFARVGRGLKLTEKGQLLLRASRSAMRLVDDALDEVPRLRVSADGRLTMTYLSPALDRVRRAHPTLVTSASVVSARDVEAQLLTGLLDAAVVEYAPTHPELTVTLVGAASTGVYCGPTHPLRRQRSVSLADSVRHPFAAPPVAVGGPSADGWPMEVPRIVMLRTAVVDCAITACASGGLLVVLPDDVARSASEGNLHRLPWVVGEPFKVYAVRRRALVVGESIVEAWVGELSKELAAQPWRRAKRSRAPYPAPRRA